MLRSAQFYVVYVDASPTLGKALSIGEGPGPKYTTRVVIRDISSVFLLGVCLAPRFLQEGDR